MIKKLLNSLMALFILVACSAQDSDSLQMPSIETPTLPTKTPLISSTATAISAIERSPTPFPDQTSLKALTEDGKWEISVLLGYDSTIQVRSVDGNKIWILDETTLPDVRLGQLWNYRAANDNRALFFGLDPRQSETMIIDRFPPSYGLYKLNLADGAIETILEPHIDSSGHVSNGYFALSPDKAQIVYSWWDEPAIVFRDIGTHQEQIVSLPDTYKVAGPFAWAPNGKSVIFTMWSNVWEYPTEFQVARLDIDSKSIHSLYSDNEENRFFVPYEWVQEDLVFLHDRKSGKLWQINPMTGELQKVVSVTP